jgi:hypothetical protein
VLAQVGWSLACAAYQPPPRWLHTLDAAFEAQLRAAVAAASGGEDHGREVGARGSSRRQHAAAAVEAACMYASVRCQLGASPAPQAVGHAIVQLVLQQPATLDAMSAAQLAVLLGGLASMGVAPPVALLGHVTQCVQGHMQAGGRFTGLRSAAALRPADVAPTHRPAPPQLPVQAPPTRSAAPHPAPPTPVPGSPPTPPTRHAATPPSPLTPKPLHLPGPPALRRPELGPTVS